MLAIVQCEFAPFVGFDLLIMIRIEGLLRQRQQRVGIFLESFMDLSIYAAAGSGGHQ